MNSKESTSAELTRACPECKRGRVIVADLHKGAPCNRCNSLIEFDFIVVAGIPVALTLLSFLLFRTDYGELGIFTVLLLIVYTSGYSNVLARFMPMKHYGE